MLPLSLACLMSFWRILGPAPVNSQKAVMTCEWSEIPLPRSLFNRFSPMINRVAITAGVNGPNFDTLPMVHLAREGSEQARTAVPENVARVLTGVELMKAGIIIAEILE